MASINDLMANKDFVVGVVEAKTPAELGEVLERNNVKLEDGMSLEDAFDALTSKMSDEISEQDLESISGGSLTMAMIGATVYLCGGAAALSALWGCAKAEYKKYKR